MRCTLTCRRLRACLVVDGLPATITSGAGLGVAPVFHGPRNEEGAAAVCVTTVVREQRHLMQTLTGV